MVIRGRASGIFKIGGIEFDLERTQNIVSSYGLEMNDYCRLMREEVLRDEVIESCYSKMMNLPEDKLKLIKSVLDNL